MVTIANRFHTSWPIITFTNPWKLAKLIEYMATTQTIISLYFPVRWAKLLQAMEEKKLMIGMLVMNPDDVILSFHSLDK